MLQPHSPWPRPRATAGAGLGAITARTAIGGDAAAAVLHATACATLEHRACRGRRIEALVVGTADPAALGSACIERGLRRLAAALLPASAPAFCVTLGGASNLAQTLRAARALVAHEGLDNVLVIELTTANGGQTTEGPVVSALGLLVTATDPEWTLLTLSQLSQSETDAAHYRDVLETALTTADVFLSQVDALLMPGLPDETAQAVATACGLPLQPGFFPGSVPGASWAHGQPLGPGAHLLVMGGRADEAYAVVCRRS